MSANNPLRLKLDEGSYSLAKGYLVDLGYETERIYKGYGERMIRASGFCVELYHKLPFRTRPYGKGMQRMMETAFIRNSSNYVRTISIENRYIFMAAQAAYHYTEDELLIREVLDLSLIHIWESFNPGLKVMGILLTRFNKRTLLSRDVMEMAQQLALQINTVVFRTKIRTGVAIAEAPAHGESIFDYNPRSSAVKDYQDLIQEVGEAIHIKEVMERAKEDQ